MNFTTLEVGTILNISRGRFIYLQQFTFRKFGVIVHIGHNKKYVHIVLYLINSYLMNANIYMNIY